MSFNSTTSSGVILWSGSPDCQAAHNAILVWLQQRVASFRTFSPVPTEPDTILKGNLGETISFCVGIWNMHPSLAPVAYTEKPSLSIHRLAYKPILHELLHLRLILVA